MTMRIDDLEALEALDLRLRAILPEEYQETYEDVQPVSMGSAALRYAVDGRVAWDDMWASFCDLAMAGGPPHKGLLLEPGRQARIDRQPDRYREVTDEICRGIMMVSGLRAQASPNPGWVRMTCLSEGMAAWLLRAIVMENVAAHIEGRLIDLPAAPDFRLEKEIKNVVTVVAKTCHYWLGHVPPAQQQSMSRLFEQMAVESPLVEPAFSDDRVRSDRDEALSAQMAEAIHRQTGLRRSAHRYVGWLGVECPDSRAAIWMMRAIVVSNVLCRREGTTLFVPVNATHGPRGDTVVSVLGRSHHLAVVRGVL